VHDLPFQGSEYANCLEILQIAIWLKKGSSPEMERYISQTLLPLSSL